MKTILRAEILCGMLLFSAFGLMVEIIFTGLGEFWSGSFKGSVSLLMIPVYSLSYILGVTALPVIRETILFKLSFRIPLIILTVYIIEWAFGAFYAALGLTPWYYDHGWASEFSNGHITLYFLPAWAGFSLIVVPAILIIQEISPNVVNELKKQNIFS